MAAADDFSELADSLGGATSAAAAFSAIVDNLTRVTAAEAAALAQATLITDRMDAAAQAAGISIQAMAASISDLAEKAAKAKALDEAKRAMEDIQRIQSGPIDEVAQAMQRLQKQAHESKVLDEAKRRMGQLEPPANASTKALNALGESAARGAERLAPTSGALGAVTDALSALGPKGRAAAAVISVIVTVVTAAAVAFWNLATAAVSVSQAKDALVETFGALGDGTQTGKELFATIEAIADRLPFAGAQTEKWAQSLLAVGKQGPALEQSILAIASATALMGDEGGRAAEGLTKRFALMADTGQKVKLERRLLSQLAEAGVSAKALAAELGLAPEKLGGMSLEAGKLGEAMERALITKGAGALARMSLTWKSITAKLGDAWEDLFEDLGPSVEPLMSAIHDLFSEFAPGSTLVNAGKGVMASFFDTVFGWATRVVRALQIMFLEAQIGALKAYVALAPLIKIFVLIFTNALVLRGIKTILVLIAVAAAAVVVALGAMGAAMAFVGGIFSAVGAVIWAAVLSIIGAIEGVVETFITGGTKGAEGFITGMVQGIKTGASEVAQAVRDLAATVEKTFTDFFQIKSPSRLMAKHGRQLPAGQAEGVREGAPEVREAMDDLWSPPRARAGGAPRASGRAKLAETINFHFQGRREDFDDFRAYIEKWLDQQEAAGPEPEPT